MYPELYLFILVLLFPLFVTGEIKNNLFDLINQLSPFPASYEDLSKIGHILIFALIPLILFRHKIKIPVIAIIVIMFALSTETIQLFIPQRTAKIYDVIIDITSSFSIILVILFFTSLKDDYDKSKDDN